MDYISLDDIKDKLDFFHKMYDVVRLIDPLHKKVLEYRNSSLDLTKDFCYNYWESGKICDNCISIRSYYENRSFVKMEKCKDSVLLVTAIPIEHAARPAVLELLKNATDTMLIGSGDYNEGEMLIRFVQELNDAAVRDPLTSLYNRRFLDERLPVNIIEAALSHLPLSVCFIDLDNFKLINDLYGHESGDLSIKAVSEAIQRNMVADDAWAARYGGDEFVLAFPGTESDQALLILERIQKEVEKIPVSKEADRPGLTISFGIETMKDTLMTAKELLRSADEKMYLAKKLKKQI
ncbi:GGDEF domain-containing protein [Lachnospiraceae bacterium 54-53]